MLLAVDIGNTNTVLGLFDREGNEGLREHWRLHTDVNRTPDEWMLHLSQLLAIAGLSSADVSGVALASVVPTVRSTLERTMARFGWPVLVLTWQTDTGIDIRLQDPSELGPDRLANAAGARARSNETTIVVDMGTATTLDVVSADGEYLGGVILPGMQVSLDALFSRAAALRAVSLTPPNKVMGTSTRTAMQSGATFGFAAQIDGLCERVQEEVGSCDVVSTGGLAGLIAPVSRTITEHDPWLTLHGLRAIYARNNR